MSHRLYSIIFITLFFSSLCHGNTTNPLIGTWSMTSIACLKSEGTISKSMLATFAVNSTFTFNKNGNYSITAKIPLTCTFTMSGQFSVNEDSELTLETTDSQAIDGSIFSCPGNNRAINGTIIQSISIENENLFYLEDEEGRCPDGETPIQVYERN